MMKKLLTLLGIILTSSLAYGAGGLNYPGGLTTQSPAGCVRFDPSVNPVKFVSTGVACGTANTVETRTFAALGVPSNAGIYYCSNCAQTSPCTGAGTGAFAFGINSTWVCAMGGGGSSAFNAITSGTNTTAAMVVGSGSSLTTSGSGSITASGLKNGVDFGDFTTGGGVAVLDANTVGPTQLIATAVTAGTCTSCNLTIDADGRITSKATGAGGGTECSTTSCDLNTSTTLNGTGICLTDGTNCPAGASGTTLTADSGGSTTGANLDIFGDSNGIDTTRSGDTITVALDPTEIGDATFGNGVDSDITWTFNTSGADPVIDFLPGAINIMGPDTFVVNGSNNGVKLTGSTGVLAKTGTGSITADNLSGDATIGDNTDGTIRFTFDPSGGTNPTLDVTSSTGFTFNNNVAVSNASFSVSGTAGQVTINQPIVTDNNWFIKDSGFNTVVGFTASTGVMAPTGTGVLRANDVVCTSCIALATETSGTLPIANGGTNLTTATDDNAMVGNGTTWQSKALPLSTGAGQVLQYDTSTNAFSAHTIADADVPNTITLTAASNLTSNGFVKTSGGAGTLSIDTTTYLSSLTEGNYIDVSGQTITFDPTELGGTTDSGLVTWGDNSQAGIDWTINVSGSSDPVLNFITGNVGFTNATLTSKASTPSFNLTDTDIPKAAGLMNGQCADSSNCKVTVQYEDSGLKNLISGDGTGSLIVIGSANAASVTLTTDGTGDGEVVLPANSISSTEMTTTGVTAGTYTRPDLTIDAAGRVTSATAGLQDPQNYQVRNYGTNSTTCGSVNNPCKTATGTNGVIAKINTSNDNNAVTCSAAGEGSATGCMRCSGTSTSCNVSPPWDTDCTAPAVCSPYTCSDDSTKGCAFRCNTTTTQSCTDDFECPNREKCCTSATVTGCTAGVNNGVCTASVCVNGPRAGSACSFDFDCEKNSCAGATASCSTLNTTSVCTGGTPFCLGARKTYGITYGAGTFADVFDNSDATHTIPSGGNFTIHGAGKGSTILSGSVATGIHFNTTNKPGTAFEAISVSCSGAAACIGSTGSGGAYLHDFNMTYSSTTSPGLSLTGYGNRYQTLSDVFLWGLPATSYGTALKFENYGPYNCTDNVSQCPSNDVAGDAICGAISAGKKCTSHTCSNNHSTFCTVDGDCSGGGLCRAHSASTSAFEFQGSDELYINNTLIEPPCGSGAPGIDFVGKACGTQAFNNRFVNSLVLNTDSCGTATTGFKLSRDAGSLGCVTGNSPQVKFEGVHFDAQILEADLDIDVGANTTLIVQDADYNACNRSVAGVISYADTTNNSWGGGENDLGTLNCNSPANPQDGEHWTTSGVQYSRAGGVTYPDPQIPNGAAGDLIYHSGAGPTFSLLTAGATDTVLQITGGVPVWNAALKMGASQWTNANHTHVSAATGGTLATAYSTGIAGAQTFLLSNNNNGTMSLAGGNGTGLLTVGSGSSNGTIYGTTGASGTLTLGSTSNGTAGKILFGTSGYNESNNRLGIGNSSPAVALDVTGEGRFSTAGTNSASAVLVGGTQTLTNKTLTSPVISSISNTGTLTLPTATGTVTLQESWDTCSEIAANVTGETGTCGSLVLSQGPTLDTTTFTGTTIATGDVYLNKVVYIGPTPTATNPGLTPTPTGATPTPTVTPTFAPGDLVVRHNLCVGTCNAAQTEEIEVMADTGASAQLRLTSASSNSLSGSNLIMKKMRGSIASPTAIQSGDSLGAMQWLPYDGTAFASSGAAYRVDALENMTTSAHGMTPVIVEVYTGTTATVTAVKYKDGHIIYFGTAPTVTGCQTIASQVGNDKAGRFASGAGVITTCTLTFNKAYITNAPVCEIVNETTAAAVIPLTTTTTAITFTGAASTTYSYSCVGFE